MKEKKAEVIIFDCLPVLAYLLGEKKGQKVKSLLKQAKEGKIKIYLSRINWGEIFYILLRETDEKKAKELILTLELLPISIVEVDKNQTW